MSVAASLCQSVLDALTDIDMPKRHPARTTQGSIEADGIWLPVYACDALVLGHAKSPRRHIRVLGIGRADPAYGCDRRAWRSRLPQPSALAAPWTKIRPMWKRWDRCALSSLQYLGLPVPLDRLGAALRYQTDHDEAGRATSCGPRTSRLMVKVLAEESARLGVPVLNRCVGAKSVWDRHAARWISLESVGNVRAVPALHPFRRYRWHRSAISWAITIERHRNSPPTFSARAINGRS